MKILICTIMRNVGNKFENYVNQINSIVNKFPEHEFHVSIYENDSMDDTKKNLSNVLLNDKFKSASIVCEDIGSMFYGSVSNEDRVRNLSNARNVALSVNPLEFVDFVLWIEPDILLTIDTIKFLLEHGKQCDIISPLSMRENGTYIADAWATRLTSNCVNCELLIKTGIHVSRQTIPVWSTFNCVCLYNADAFRNGARFGYINERLGIWDCDTVVVCEEFRKLGYNKIFVDTSHSIRWY